MKIKQFTKGTLLITTLLSLTACMEVKDLNQDNSNSMLETKSITNEFSYKLQDHSELNKFEITLNIPKDKKYTLRRKHVGNVNYDFQIEVYHLYNDLNIQPNTDYIYTFGTYENGIFSEEKNLLVKVPIDLKIESHTNLIAQEADSELIRKLSRVHRLIFSDGATLITNGLNLLIHADEVISTNGHIRTFENQTPNSLNGFDGGTITIFTRTGTGDLSIEMLGQNGSNGTPGSSATKAQSAGNGTDAGNGGNSGNFRYFLMENARNNLALKISHLPGHAGIGGAGGKGGVFTHCMKAAESCDTFEKEPGKTGQNGIAGAIGRTCSPLGFNEDYLLDSTNYSCQ